MTIIKIDDLKSKIVQKLKTVDNNHLFKKGQKFKKTSKSSQESEKAKLAGNNLFLSSNHDFQVHHKIMSCYNKSIAYAPSHSEELAIAYGNKAALLLHMRKYSESISEADKALGITKSVALRVKLLCRKAECHTALGSPENGSCLEKAKFLISKIDETDQVKELLNNLMNKSQLVVQEGKLDTPKEAKRKVQGMKLVSDAEESEGLNSVTIAYSKKYGKHLIATRSFETGEIVFVEKPYFNTVPDSKAYAYCYHCLKYLWTVVPCDHCAWRVFCSMECRDEAFDEYHKMECSIFLNMGELLACQSLAQVQVIMSLFFKALKESGGDVHQLQADLESIDRDECTTGISSNEITADYKTVFSLPTRTLHEYEIEFALTNALVAVSGIAKFTQIFGNTYNYNELKKLMKNKTALFIGALLAKYSIIITSRCARRVTYDPSEKLIELEDLGNGKRLMYQELMLGEQPPTSLPVLSHLNILSCIPNITKVFTHENKCIAFALHPIKKGDQITSSTALFYFDMPKSERQQKYHDLHKRPCECRACLENWPEVGIKAKGGIMIRGETEEELLRAAKLCVELHSLIDEFGDGRSKSNHPDVKLLMKAARLVEKIWNDFPLPSSLSVNSINILMRICAAFYTPVEDHLEFSEPCGKKLTTNST